MEKHPRLLWVLDAGLFLSTLASLLLSFRHHEDDFQQLMVVLVFVVFFGLRYVFSSKRVSFLKRNWFDLALIVLLASPALRVLMLFRFGLLIRLLRLTLLFRLLTKRLKRLLILSSDSLPTALSLLLFVVFVFGVSAYCVEYPTNAAFGSYADGLWWAFVTLTSVGYGDVYPMTGIGRVVGVLTMLLGMLVYSLVIANMSAWLAKQEQQRSAPSKRLSYHAKLRERKQKPRQGRIFLQRK